MCATSNSTLSNHQRYYYSLYAKSLTPLSCNLGLPRIRYSFPLHIQFVSLHHRSCISSSVLSRPRMSYHANATSVIPIMPNTMRAVHTTVVKSVILHHSNLIFDRNSSRTLYPDVHSPVFPNMHFRK